MILTIKVYQFCSKQNFEKINFRSGSLEDAPWYLLLNSFDTEDNKMLIPEAFSIKLDQIPRTFQLNKNNNFTFSNGSNN